MQTIVVQCKNFINALFNQTGCVQIKLINNKRLKNESFSLDVTLRHKICLNFKYGKSDNQFQFKSG
jgi:hypothetical protein